MSQDRDEQLMTVAHELRTPLTAAKAMAELCQAAVATGRTEQLSDYLARLMTAIDSLVLLMNDLTDATRPDQPALEIGPVDVRAAIEQACTFILPAADKKGITMIPPADGPLIVQGRREALVSILTNLLSNAVRYSPPKTIVTIRLRAEEDQAHLEVQDMGRGISPEEQAPIFEPFYRSPQAKEDEPRGLGVGLAIVKRLVEAQGGQITVSSIPGQGSTFRVTLPLSPVDPTAVTESP